MATTWYAQIDDNFDSVSAGTISDIWNDAIDGSGNWLDLSDDYSADTFRSNNHTIELNIDVTCSVIDSSAGGYFDLTTDGVTLITSDIVAHDTTCLNIDLGDGESCTVYGDIAGSDTSANVRGCLVSGSGTVTIIGNISAGGEDGAYGIYDDTDHTGTLNITGDITAGAGSNGYGYYCVGTATITITGDITAAAAEGMYVNGQCTLSITGDIYGSDSTSSQYGIYFSSSCDAATITITGDVQGRSQNNAHGIFISESNAGFDFTLTGDVYSGSSWNCYGIVNPFSTNSVVLIGNIINDDKGPACSGAITYTPAAGNYVQYPTSGGGTIKLYPGDQPDAPTLAVADNEDQDSVTASVTGTGTITLYYKLHSATVWTEGEGRSGDGDIVQTGLEAGSWYDFLAVATDAYDNPSLPSSMISLRIAPAGEPIVEQILQDIETVINTVTEANGYQQDLACVRPMMIDWQDVTPANGDVVLVYDDETDTEAEAIGTDERIQRFECVILIIDSKDSSVEHDRRCARAAADLRQALAADHTRGGLAIDTFFPPMYFTRDLEFPGIVVPVLVQYRTDYEDPYTGG